MTWWRNAVLYEIYARSYADGNGDGIGDIAGIRAKLPYLASLGIDGIWITPFYPSPMADHGYDVADYCDVDPMFGTLEDFTALLADAHEHGLRVVCDLVPNHTSSEHVWFKEALADPSSAARARYIFRDPKPDGSPPNNWRSVFGGPAWTLDEASGQYYLHLFAPEQPDLDWYNPEVHAEMDRVLRFWLDLGVDGFRIDVAHGLYKHPELPDSGDTPELFSTMIWNRPEVHEVYRRWNALAATYDPPRLLCGEVFLFDHDIVADYVRADELHQAFNFSLLSQPFDAARWHAMIELSLRAHGRVGAACTWVLSNHDLIRHVTRYGTGDMGRRRAAAALIAMLALPGGVYLYQGEELGLDHVEVPPERRQDPIWERSGHKEVGRDGCRTPMPWSASPPGFGFTTATEAWLPFNPDAATRNVETLDADEESLLWLYRKALALRKTTAALRGEEFAWVDAPTEVLAFRRDGLLVALNTGSRSVELPADGKIVIANREGVTCADGVLHLPPDSAAWVETT